MRKRSGFFFHYTKKANGFIENPENPTVFLFSAQFEPIFYIDRPLKGCSKRCPKFRRRYFPTNGLRLENGRSETTRSFLSELLLENFHALDLA